MNKNIKHLMLIWFLLRGYLAVLGQPVSYDIFTINLQPDWSMAENAGNLQFTLQRGNTWCVLGLYASTGTTGNVALDFQSDWNDLVGKNYQLTTEVSTEQNEVNGWQMIAGSATGDISGQRVNISLITFSGPRSRATVLMTNNDLNNELEAEIAAFAGSISVSNSTDPISQGYPQNTTTAYPKEQSPPMSTTIQSGIFPTPGEQPVIASVMMDEGWFVEATNDYMVYTRSDIKVVEYFLTETPYPDKDQYWQQHLSRYFSADNYQVLETTGPSYFSVEVAWGYAVYIPDGQTYFIAWLIDYNVPAAFVAITSDEAVFRSYFPDPKNLGEMQRYNNFPVDVQSIQGEWTESNFGGAQMYEVNTGNYAGMSFASAASSFAFSGNNFRFFSQGATGMVGTASTFQVEENGTFDVSTYNLVTNITSRTDQMTKTTIQKQETTEYSVAFKYAKNTRILFLQNRKYTGMTYNLVKK